VNLGADTPLPPPVSSDLWGLIPRPLAVLLAVILAIGWVISDLSGKLNGPINRILQAREKKAKEAAAAAAAAAAEPDRRVVELEETLGLVDDRVRRLLEQLNAQGRELQILHRISDAQARAIRAHTAWDNQWLPRLRAALPELQIPDPPVLYVDMEEAP
jgi:hypothetical protein